MSNHVDTIGTLKAQIAALTNELRTHERALKDQGPGHYHGQLFDVTVAAVHTERVDWKAVAAKLAPSRQLVTAHTKAVDSVRLTVNARQQEQAA